MRARYERNTEGRMVLQARVYPSSEHSIEKKLLSREVLHIIERLQNRGFQACVVGGAIRDLLIGRKPKDFDVACSARPEEVRRVFNNSRIIGKRFRLVHVIFPGNHVVEVATFRAIDNTDHKPVYGSIDQDAKRRDFSLNGLYYDPSREEIIDYINGISDIRHRIIRPIIPLEQIFVEDPVRMLRCLKFSAMFDFRIAGPLARQLKRNLPLLASSSHSRLSEELLKILLSGYSAPIFRKLSAYRACAAILPHFPLPLHDRRRNKVVLHSLERLDTLRSEGPLSLGVALSHLLETSLQPEDFVAVEHHARPLFTQIKEILAPLSFPNVEILRCIAHLCQRHDIDLSFNKLQTQKWIQRRQGYSTRRRRGPAPSAKGQEPKTSSETAENVKPKRQRRRVRPTQKEENTQLPAQQGSHNPGKRGRWVQPKYES